MITIFADGEKSLISDAAVFDVNEYTVASTITGTSAPQAHAPTDV